jgi:hypothetical protein
MPIRLTLDESALRALFPEGSEAEIQLRGAVIGTIVERAFTDSTRLIEAQVKSNIERLFEQNMATLGVRKNSYSGYYLTDEAKLQIKATAKRIFDEIAAESLGMEKSAMELLRLSALQSAEKRLEREIGAGLDSRINKLIRTELAKIVNPT